MQFFGSPYGTACFLALYVCMFAGLTSGGLSATEKNRALSIEITLEAPVAQIWAAWTTEAGIQSFFAPGCQVNMEIDGFYEIFFYPENPPGSRGAEGMRIMAIEPEKLFSFTWNQPPMLPTICDQRTLVTLKFEELSPEKTRLTFIQTGWGDGPEWDKAIDYFTIAWRDVVLFRLQHSIKHGAIDWQNPPSKS